MKKPFVGSPVTFADYFKGGLSTYFTGILEGVIGGVGMSLSLIASGRAGYAISHGLGQGATMIAALWGVFVWKEFRSAPAGTTKLIRPCSDAFSLDWGLLLPHVLRNCNLPIMNVENSPNVVV